MRAKERNGRIEGGEIEIRKESKRDSKSRRDKKRLNQGIRGEEMWK